MDEVCWSEVFQKAKRTSALRKLVEVIVGYFAYISELQCTVVIITALQKPLYLQLPEPTGRGRDKLQIEEKCEGRNHGLDKHEPSNLGNIRTTEKSYALGAGYCD